MQTINNNSKHAKDIEPNDMDINIDKHWRKNMQSSPAWRYIHMDSYDGYGCNG